MTDVNLGIYRHYKGNLYQVLGVAHDANADSLYPRDDHSLTVPYTPLGERTVVVYIGLQLDDAHFGPRMAVRTLDDFIGWQTINKDQLKAIEELNRKTQWQFWEIGIRSSATEVQVRRFTYLGVIYSQDMVLR